jgi:3-hydroxybutyryl-CoA dehydrogenase
VLGLHFFNPVPLMPLVEVVRTIKTGEEAFNKAWAFVESIKKIPVAAKDTAGFIVNLLLIPYLLDAIRVAGEGIASVEDIDKGMKYGCGHPMGPLALLDLIGLDVIYNVATIMYREYREKRYAPPPLLRQMVLGGYFGVKTGRGFYDYRGDEPVPVAF